MTQTELYSSIRALGLTISKCDSEYRINNFGGTEASAYYTNDRDDALGTARLIASQQDGPKCCALPDVSVSPLGRD